MPGTVHSHQHHLIILQQTMKTQGCNNKIVSYQKSFWISFISIIGLHRKTHRGNNKIHSLLSKIKQESLQDCVRSLFASNWRFNRDSTTSNTHFFNIWHLNSYMSWNFLVITYSFESNIRKLLWSSGVTTLAKNRKTWLLPQRPCGKSEGMTWRLPTAS